MEQIKEELWDIMSEIHRLASRAQQKGNNDWKALDTLYWKLDAIADKVGEAGEAPQGENVVIGGEVAYKVGGFITWD